MKTKIVYTLFVVLCLNSCSSFIDEKLGLKPIRVDWNSKPKTYLNIYAKVPHDVVKDVEKTVSAQMDVFYDKNGKKKPLEELKVIISKEFKKRGYDLRPVFFGYGSGIFVVLDYEMVYPVY